MLLALRWEWGSQGAHPCSFRGELNHTQMSKWKTFLTRMLQAVSPRQVSFHGQEQRILRAIPENLLPRRCFDVEKNQIWGTILVLGQCSKAMASFIPGTASLTASSHQSSWKDHRICNPINLDEDAGCLATEPSTCSLSPRDVSSRCSCTAQSGTFAGHTAELRALSEGLGALPTLTGLLRSQGAVQEWQLHQLH